MPDIASDSPLVVHAQRELELAGLFDDDSDYGGALAIAVLDLIKLFAAQHHSGGSAVMSVSLFATLARFDNLSQITNDPADWIDVSEYADQDAGKMWQCKRNPSLFSTDGGQTYYSVEDEDQKILTAKDHEAKA